MIAPPAAPTIGEIGQDIERLLPTSGESFAMTVTGKRYTERQEAGRALMKEILTLVQLQQQGEVHIARIGGFDLVYIGEKFGRRDNYHYQTLLQRTGADYEIELPVTVTPLGPISRLERALDGFDEERVRYRQGLEEYRRRLTSYQSRHGGEFAFADELKDKRRKLHDIEEALAAQAMEDAGAESRAA